MTDAELIAFRNLFQECQCLRDKMQMEKRVGPQYIAAWEQAVSDASEAFEAIALAQPTPESVVELARKRWPDARIFDLGEPNPFEREG